MRRTLLASLSLTVFVWLSGCGGGSSNPGNNPPQPDSLKGQYAFVLSGFDATNPSSPVPVGIAGSFTADGLGHITAGEVDVNDNGTAAKSTTALSGVYSFDKTGSGNDTTLGIISLSNTAGTAAPQKLAFAFALQANGGFGQIMSLDTNNFTAAGTMQLQSSSAFTLAGLAGNFVVTLNGRNSVSPTSALGSFTLNADGTTSNDTFDRSIAGVNTAGPTTGASASLTFSGTAPDANGRGTFTLALNDGLVVPPVNQTFAYYAITPKRIVAVETDAGGTMTADFASQTIPPTPTTTGSVFGMAGVDTAVSNEITAVGQLVMTGTSATAGTLLWDSNDNGTIKAVGPLSGQNVSSYDSTTGRGIVTVASGTNSELADTLVFYLTAPGTGFIMDATAGITNRAMAGPLTAQATGPFSTTTDLGGLAIVRSRASAAANAFSLVGLFGPVQGSTTNYLLLFDDRQPGFADVLDQGQSITLGTLDGNTGRGTFSLQNTGGASTTFAYYIITPNQFNFLDITASDSATLIFANPD